MRSKFALLLVLAGCLLAVAPASATILIFDQSAPNTPTAPNAAVDQNYGDNVSSLAQGGFTYGNAGEGFTPHVTTSYSNSVFLWTDGYGDLVNII